MLLYTDKDGRYIGHLDQAYPALPEVFEKVSADQEGEVYDIPPFVPEFWYFPEGIPTIRPQLAYTVTETEVGGDKVTVITGIPARVLVRIGGPEGVQDWEADGEELELVTRTEGDYSVSFDPFPHQPVVIHIAVTKGA